MGLQIIIRHNGVPVIYNVTTQENEVYHLRLFESNDPHEYIPEKIMIRRKGKIWISDIDNTSGLVGALTEELKTFSPEI
jgi:hypothetical protein